MCFPLPKWVEEMPEGRDKIRAENLFFFRLWCIYAGPKASYHELAALLGVNCSTLRSQATNRMVCGATDSTVKLIRELFGPTFLPSRRVPYSRES
jgi:hypothetical protein